MVESDCTEWKAGNFPIWPLLGRMAFSLATGDMGADAWGDGEFETITRNSARSGYVPVREGIKSIPMGDCLLGIRGVFWINGKQKEATDLIFDMYRKQEGLEENQQIRFLAGDITLSLKELDATEDLSGAVLLKREKEGSVFRQKPESVSESIWCSKKLPGSAFNQPASWILDGFLSRTPYKKNGMHVNTQLFPEDGSGFLQERYRNVKTAFGKSWKNPERQKDMALF